jgi:hypothetical protein
MGLFQCCWGWKIEARLDAFVCVCVGGGGGNGKKGI